MTEQQQQDKMIKLVSCDNEEFVVPQTVAFMSTFVKQLSTINSSFGNEIVIPDVTGAVLKKVIDFCRIWGRE